MHTNTCVCVCTNSCAKWGEPNILATTGGVNKIWANLGESKHLAELLTHPPQQPIINEQSSSQLEPLWNLS